MKRAVVVSCSAAALFASTVTASSVVGAQAGTGSDDIQQGTRQFVDPLAVTTDWNASDGFRSRVLPDKRTLWLYGDTVTDDGRMPRNSMSIWDPTRGYVRFDDGADERGFIWRPGTSPTDIHSRWYWSGTPLANTSSLVHIPAGRVEPNPAVRNGTRVTATDIITYRYNSRDAKLTRLSEHTTPTVKDGTGVIRWTAASAKIGAHVYLYGLASSGAYGFNVYVMRIATTVLEGRAPLSTDWELLTLKGWRRARTMWAKDLRRVGESFSNVFSVVAVEGKVYAVVKTYEVCGKSIDLYRADSVRSSFKFRRSLATIPDITGTMTYHVNMHTALPAPRGKVWITVARNIAPGNRCTAWTCPQNYRPVFRLIPAPSQFPDL